MKYIVLVFFVFNSMLMFSQIDLQSIDVTKECKETLNKNGTHLIEILDHSLIGPKGEYEIVYAHYDSQFLNVYCVSAKFNTLIILSSKKKNGKWEQYFGMDIFIPKLELSNKEIAHMEFFDINTVYVAYVIGGEDRKSYVVKLTESGYSVYEYLDDPFLFNEEELPKRKILGRPKF